MDLFTFLGSLSKENSVFEKMLVAMGSSSTTKPSFSASTKISKNDTTPRLIETMSSHGQPVSSMVSHPISMIRNVEGLSSLVQAMQKYQQVKKRKNPDLKR